MSNSKFKFQMYKYLQENISNIYSEAKKLLTKLAYLKIYEVNLV